MNRLTRLTKTDFLIKITILTLFLVLSLHLAPTSAVFAGYIAKNTDTVEGMEEYVPTDEDLKKKINLSLTVSRVSFKTEKSGVHKYEIFYKGKNFPQLMFSSSEGATYILTTGEESFGESLKIVKGQDLNDSWRYICIYLNSAENTEWKCDITPGALIGFIFTENEIPDIITESDTSACKTNVRTMIAWGMSGNKDHIPELKSLLFPDKAPYIPYVAKEVDYTSLITLGAIFGGIFAVLGIGYGIIKSKQNKKIRLQKEAERIKARKRELAEEDKANLIKDLQAINAEDADEFVDYPPIEYKQYLRLDPPKKEESVKNIEPKPVSAREPVTAETKTPAHKPVPEPVQSLQTHPEINTPVTNTSRPAWLTEDSATDDIF